MSSMSEPFEVAFDEWMRRYEADPAKFAMNVEGKTYGERCARYFEKLLDELAEGKPWDSIKKSAT